MTLFSIVAALLAVLVALVVVWPLLRPRAGKDAREHALEVYRDQLDEVDRDLERGLIRPAEADAAKLEVKRRLLGAARGQALPGPRSTSRPVIALIVGLFVVGGALWSYERLGRPDLPGQPLAQRDTGALQAEREGMARELEELEAMAAEDPPDDPRFYLSLGQLRTELHGPLAGGEAYMQGLERYPNEPLLRAALGESLVGQADGIVTPAAREQFALALEAAPAQPLALYYLGLASAQEGDDPRALELWGRMLWRAPADVPWRSVVEERFRAAASREGIDADRLLAEGPAERPEPTPAAPAVSALAATGGLDDGDQQQMILGMVQGLEDRLAEQPDDVEGWLRLGRAKLVLGERDAGVEAFARARALRPADPRVLIAEADALLVAGERTMGIPIVTPEVADLFRRAAALDPADPQPHWYLGLRALQQGRIDAARAAWEQVLARVDPASEDYAAVRAQIEALPQAEGG